MIVPMKKYSFLVYHQEYLQFLKDIQDLGVLHVIEKADGELINEELKEKYQLIYRLSSAIKFLEKRKTASKETYDKPGEALTILEEFENLRFDAEVYTQQLQTLEKEKYNVEPWGSFSLESIADLEKNGYKVRFFVGSAKNFDDAWIDQYNAFKINQVGATQYFVTITSPDQPMEVDAEEVKVPERPLDAVKAEIARIQGLIDKSEEMLNDISQKYIPTLEQKRAEIQESFEFDKVVLNTEKKAEEKLMVLEGWIPVEKEQSLIDYLNDSSVYYESDKPQKEDRPPIMLKNNKFARLFEPLGDLYSLPKYNEIDLTPFFAPFYLLFFGFCLGDAGYGILLMMAGFLKPKVSPDMKKIVSLVQWLGFSTILFGIIGGTFFGINLYEQRFAFYGDLHERFQAQGNTINDYLFYLSLIIGGIQIIFGMFIKAFNEAIKGGSVKYAFGTIGWLILIIGAGVSVLLKNTGVLTDESFNYALYAALGVGGVFILLLNNPDRNILINFGGGLWDTYNMITGRLGDLLSYIRLFALGISSAILGYVFNSLAISMSGDLPIVSAIIMVIILAIGHAINIFMSGLGAFVHPMRLTFVEFYSNAGFGGGGKKYIPFSRKTKPNESV
jgi:V/A-type H+-transporting ATPase subunit I